MYKMNSLQNLTMHFLSSTLFFSMSYIKNIISRTNMFKIIYLQNIYCNIVFLNACSVNKFKFIVFFFIHPPNGAILGLDLEGLGQNVGPTRTTSQC